MEKLYTVQELITLSTAYLGEKGCASPRLDAELLLAHVLKVDRVRLYLNLERPLEKEEVDAYRRLIGLRGNRIPVAYLVKQKEFYGHQFVVNEAVLIPRPETELLIYKTLTLLQGFTNPQVLDLGTGSGVIGITIALELPQAKVLATDISHAALRIAKLNADRLGVADQLSFLSSDMFSQIPNQKFDLICSNPPYIASHDLTELEPEVKLEPNLALDGGKDGLDYYRILLGQAGAYLTSGGFLLLEIGHDQADSVTSLGVDHGFNLLEVIQDYSAFDRVVVMQWP